MLTTNPPLTDFQANLLAENLRGTSKSIDAGLSELALPKTPRLYALRRQLKEAGVFRCDHCDEWHDAKDAMTYTEKV